MRGIILTLLLFLLFTAVGFAQDNNKKINELFLVAAKAGYVPVVEILIKKGAIINSADSEGKTALIHALENANTDVIDLLLLYGFNLNGFDTYGVTPLIRMIYYNNIEAVRLLIAYGVDVNKFNRKKSLNPLMYAVQQDLPEIFNLLLDSGADINITNRQGISPIMVAAQYNSVKTAQMLIDAGADINAWTINRMTPLMIATYANSFGVMKLLTDAGAIMNIPGAITSVKTLPISTSDIDRMTDEFMEQAKKEREEKNRETIEFYAFGAKNTGSSNDELLCAYFDKLLKDLGSSNEEEINRAIVFLYSSDYREIVDKLALDAPHFRAYQKIYTSLDDYISAVSSFEFSISEPSRVRAVLDFKVLDISRCIRRYRGLAK